MSYTSTSTNVDELANQVIAQCLQSRRHIPDQKIVNVAALSTIEAIKNIARPSRESVKSDQLLEDAQTIFEHRVRMDHPRFFGFIPGPASDISWLGDVLNSAHNAHAGSWYQSSGPSAVESTLIAWAVESVGLPPTAGGCFVSGGSMANMTAMAIARDQKLSFKDRPRSIIYISNQTHSSITKGLHILGFHPSQIHKIECTTDNVMNTTKLEAAIQHDLNTGNLPFMIVGTCGTTNTGSIDPLTTLDTIAKRHNLWFHIDGAYGATIALSTQHAHLAAGLRHCDSLSWDMHKWLFQTYGCGLVLVRQKSWLTDTFATSAEYIQDAAEEGGQEFPNFWNYGMELTRPARAMKLWFFLRFTGLDEVGKMIDHGVLLAETAERELSSSLSDWLVESPARLGIVCFRFAPGGVVESSALDELNATISKKAIEENVAAALTTRLNGRTVLRICSISPDLTVDGMVDVVRGLDRVARSLYREFIAK